MRTHILATTAIAALLAAALFSSGANAQIDIFVRVNGVHGDSTDEKHKSWIEATAVTENLQGGSISSAGAATARGIVKSFTITKNLDQSSPILKLNLMQGMIIPEVVIEYVKTSGNKTKFYTITLRQVVITAMVSKVEGGVQIEEVALEFTSIEWSYFPVDKSGKEGTPVKSGWDLKANKKL